MTKDETALLQLKRASDPWETVFAQLSPGFAMNDPEFRRLRDEFLSLLEQLDAHVAPKYGWEAFRRLQEAPQYELDDADWPED